MPFQFAPERFKVWAGYTYNDWPGLPALKGHKLRGEVVRYSARRWNLFSRNGRLIGYTIGGDGPAAGTTELLFGRNLDDC